MNAIELRNVLEQLLTDSHNKLGGRLIGKYTYESGFIDTAIAIGNPPNTIDVEGLECLLPLFPDTSSEWTAASIHCEETWDVLLIQREVADMESPTLPAAVDRLRRFLTASEGVYVPQDETLGSYPQYRLTFKFSDLHPIINRV